MPAEERQDQIACQHVERSKKALRYNKTGKPEDLNVSGWKYFLF